MLDGKLDDAAWTKAEASTAFVQKFPNEGKSPSERTTLRIVYDDANVYVAFDCEQRSVPIVERLTRRGRLVESDWVSVAMGTRGDGKSAFEFLVNASGVRVDALRFNDNEKTEDRDENWEAETAVRDDGWSAEFRIPLHLLRFASAPEQTWDLQARRYISNLQETEEWAFFTRSAGGEVSHYGKLLGLRGLTPRAPVELRPFVLGKMEQREQSSEQLDSGTSFAASAGLDLKWHPANDLTLDLTVNPDFAQVEADQQVLNLSTFETYFPEKRPFFLEGVDVFATPIQLLYTRRIGRAPGPPRVRGDVPFEEQVVRLPTARTIYGASKLTGQIAKGWSVGTLQAVTGEGQVDVEDVSGSQVSPHGRAADGAAGAARAPGHRRQRSRRRHDDGHDVCREERRLSARAAGRSFAGDDPALPQRREPDQPRPVDPTFVALGPFALHAARHALLQQRLRGRRRLALAFVRRRLGRRRANRRFEPTRGRAAPCARRQRDSRK